MTVLEQIRAENPNLALIPDEELLQKLLLEYQGDLDPDVYMQSLMGEEPVVSPVEAPVLGGKRALAPTSNVNDIGFGQALTGPAKSSWARSWGPSITRLKGGIAALSGNEDRAQELYSQAQQEDRGILQNSGYVSFAQATEGPDAGVDTFVKAGLSAIGSSSPFLVEGIAGAVTGAKIGRFAGPVGAAIGAGVGAAVASFPRLFEFNLSRQQEQVSIGNLDTISEGKAALTALPQAALESVMFPVVGKLFGKVGRTEFSNIINRATTGRVAKGTALGVTGEAATEVGQQVLERYQAGLPIDTPEAIAEYKEAAFAGGFVGGAFGGAATLAGEATRAVQPTPIPVEKPVETPVQKPLEAPVVKGGIIQPQQQKDIAKQQAVEEQAKPVNFAVEQQADKFVVKEQSLDANNNIVKTTPLNVFNTQEEAIANQKESQEQKNKVSEQTFFTADEIKTENPTLGNIIDEVELLGNKIAPNVKQVYFQKDLALAKGNESAVKASGGTLGSSVDGWYDRTSDINFISTSNLDNIQETVAHENFHALQRVQNRASGLFTEQEQSALNTFLPGGTIDNINPLVQKALGNDVMTRLRERHLGSEVTPQEMQAYAFGAYTSMKAKGARLAAPNPVIRAFKKFFDFLKGVGNIFRKNKINNVQDLFEQARTGKIGKRAVPKEGIDELRTTSIQKAEQAAAKGVTPSVTEPSLSTVSLDDGSQIQSVIPSLVGQIGEKLVKSIYGPKGTIQLKKDFIASYLTPAQQKAKFGRNDDMKKASTIFNLSKLEQELRNNDGYIMLNNVPKGYERIGFGNKNLTTSYREDKAIFERGIKEILPSQQEFALSRVEFRKQIKNNNDDFGKKYGLKTSLSEGKKENLSKIGIALDKEHAETYKVIKETPRFVKGKIAEADQEIFDDAVEAGYQELKYQLELGGETAVSGTGWYNKAITDTIERVKDVIPQMREGSVAEQTDKELQFKLFLALFSPQGGPEQNLDVATQVFKTYLETGEAVTKKELFKDSSKFGVSHQSMVNSLKLVDYLSNKYGNKPGDLKDYLFSAQTYKELGKEKLDSGFFKPAKNQKKQDLDYSELSDVNKTSFNSDTGKIEDSILMPAFMFGEKVGTFFLNFNGIEGVTKDRWFSRHYYRQFGQVGIARNPKTGKPLKSETRMVSTIGGGKVKRTYPPGHDPVTKLRDVPKANDRKVMELYVEGIKQKAIDDGLIKGEDATRQNVQAILWYFEQGLYTDLGLKSVPVDYVQAVEALENKIKNDIQTGGQSYGQFYNTKSIKGTATDVKTKAKTGEVKFSVSQREEVKEDLELSVSPDTAIKDTDVKAFLKSGTDVTSYNPKEYFAAAETRGPLVGHCAACAYVIQKNYGGDVMQVSVPPKKGFNKQREKHYFNKLPDGTFIDLTGEQYGNQSVTPPQDFIGRAKIGPHQWGDSARYKGKLNKRFTDFEEKFNSIKEQDVENTSKNLDDILPPEFSISEDKELLNPSGTDVGANIDVDEFAIFEEILPNPTEVITDSITREKGYAAVRRFVNQRYAEQIKKFGKPVNIPDTNMSTFLFNIYAGRFPVGTGFGVRLGDTGFIDLVELNESETKYLSPSAFRKIGVDLSKQLGVKKFAGIRTTGARLKADAERIEKGLDLVNTRQDNIATSEEFNQEAFDEANNIELSVSNDMLTDKEIQNSALPSNVKNKLFLNRDLEDGTKISVRPNLNGRVIKGEDKLFVQTIHPGKNLGKAIGYDGAVRLVNPTLNVSQRARANIASKKINKYPMASAQGEYSSKKPTLDGQVLTFNPFVQHLFVDSDGFAVKSIQGEAVMYNTKIYTTGNLEYYTEENAPKPLEDINSEVKFKSSEEAETDRKSVV